MEIHRYSKVEEMWKKAMDATIAKDEPVLMPRIPGSAIGLRVTACMSAPETARAAPAARAAAVRGNRSATAAAPRSPPGPVSPCRISSRPTTLAPKAIEHSAATTTSPVSRTRTAPARRAVRGVLTGPCRRRPR